MGGNIKVLRRKFQNQFVPLTQMTPSIVPALDQLIMRCLNANPNGRPSSCDEFLVGLEEQRKASRTVVPTESRKGPSSPSDSQNRRRARRAAVHLNAMCEPMFVPSRKFWKAAITDLSLTGLCLQTTGSFEINTVLQINFHVPDASEAASKLVRIRWVKPADENESVMGCEFVQPLPVKEFDTLHQAGTPKTAVIQAVVN